MKLLSQDLFKKSSIRYLKFLIVVNRNVLLIINNNIIYSAAGYSSVNMQKASENVPASILQKTSSITQSLHSTHSSPMKTRRRSISDLLAAGAALSGSASNLELSQD